MMRGIIKYTIIGGIVGASVLNTVARVEALPGQTIGEVETWIKAHPTLRPGRGERLTVRKGERPTQRFVFEASVFSPGRITSGSSGLIRSEKLEFYDEVEGVDGERLVEALRIIYGVDIYQDYQRGRVIYTYPTAEQIERSRKEKKPLLEARKGELRVGERFAYWVEVAQPETGKAVTGRLIVFLKDDIDDIEKELRSR
ncbi:MAG: hypothetical protein N3E45_04870 [Oscillatoriaceae bacterium SKW80]|nr:hypothetical protein [Oscillatoriaceae bacterium SKYG93]MCX8120147.1 hypothetical protein [Oscillatoriaceae bacterium SKW80]MDW8453073.1 hypothetical protein [Oscillatoriaceae cyanobacterium SKYGB_i_bin93]HIK29016.1 hypothetical protein [Oscillatoriaceae cyanobacterium M7585_C2015_266]